MNFTFGWKEFVVVALALVVILTIVGGPKIIVKNRVWNWERNGFISDWFKDRDKDKDDGDGRFPWKPFRPFREGEDMRFLG